MKGAMLEGLRFRHPLYDRDSLGVLGDYVTLEQGTGAVHTAPGHGADDFLTGVKYGLDIYAPVDPAAISSTRSSSSAASACSTRTRTSKQALEDRGRLWHRETFAHQYPHCWRCHNPVIFLATSQWFIRMDGEPAITGEDGADADAARGGAARDRPRGAMDSRLGPRPHLQHGGEPAGLVHLAAAGLGRADPGGRLHGLRRSAADARARRARGGGLRAVRRRRVVRAADRGVRARRA